MQELDAAAKENNLVFMNEIGLDPGIDHMSAMKVNMRSGIRVVRCFCLSLLWRLSCS
jgi:saccharopine dehydrogenase-like NADP-dependent oxidoreductase